MSSFIDNEQVNCIINIRSYLNQIIFYPLYLLLIFNRSSKAASISQEELSLQTLVDRLYPLITTKKKEASLLKNIIETSQKVRKHIYTINFPTKCNCDYAKNHDLDESLYNCILLYIENEVSIHFQQAALIQNEIVVQVVKHSFKTRRDQINALKEKVYPDQQLLIHLLFISHYFNIILNNDAFDELDRYEEIIKKVGDFTILVESTLADMMIYAIKKEEPFKRDFEMQYYTTIQEKNQLVQQLLNQEAGGSSQIYELKQKTMHKALYTTLKLIQNHFFLLVMNQNCDFVSTQSAKVLCLMQKVEKENEKAFSMLPKKIRKKLIFCESQLQEHVALLQKKEGIVKTIEQQGKKMLGTYLEIVSVTIDFEKEFSILESFLTLPTKDKIEEGLAAHKKKSKSSASQKKYVQVDPMIKDAASPFSYVAWGM